MKVKDMMSSPVIQIRPEESVSVASRTLTNYNIGVLPVCDGDRLCGLVTDRDIVTRCLAAGRDPVSTTVREIMTGQILAVGPETDAGTAAHLMGRQQVRRLPVVENGKLCGMLSLGDISHSDENVYDAGDALTEITNNISNR